MGWVEEFDPIRCHYYDTLRYGICVKIEGVTAPVGSRVMI